jgi:hypothetical protein
VAVLRRQLFLGKSADFLLNHFLTLVELKIHNDTPNFFQWVLVECLFDLGRLHILSAGDDHVILAACNGHIFLFIPSARYKAIL